MNSKIKRRVENRILTLISKINELKILGYKDNEIDWMLPPNLEGWESELMDSYISITAGKDE